MRECEIIVERLPDLLHERLLADERERVVSHVSTCDECGAELAWLRTMREGLVTAAPRIDATAIARAVQAQLASTPTLRLVTEDAGQPVVRRARREPPARWATTGLRAAAAALVVAAGAGAVVLSRGTADRPAPAATRVARGPAIAPAPATTSAQPAPAPASPESAAAPSPAPLTVASAEQPAPLGASFSDLSDAELAAVIAAIDDEGGAVPADPSPTPNVVTPGGTE